MSRKKNFFKDMKQIIHKNLDPMRNNYKETYDAIENFLKYQKRLDSLDIENKDTLIVYLMGEEIVEWTFKNFNMLIKMNLIKNNEDDILNFIYKKVVYIASSEIIVNAPKQLAEEVLKNNKVKIFKLYHGLTKY